jgi:hypothetical protein
MRITLQRKSGIKAFEAVLTVESMTRNRPDMVELLTYIRDHGGLVREQDLHKLIGEEVPVMIVKGIVEHLKAIGMLQPNGAIAVKGRQVVESGLVPVEERGLFTLYYMEDAILQDRIIHYERSGRRKSAVNTSVIEEARFSGFTYVSLVDQKTFKVKHFDGNQAYANVSDDNGAARLRWEIDLNRVNVSQFSISGELRAGSGQSFRSNNYTANVLDDFEPKRFLQTIIEQVKASEMSWNPSTECLEVPLNTLPEQDYISLQTTLKVPALTNFAGLGDFESSDLHAVPIAPKNAADAKKWIMLLLTRFLSEGYKNEREFMQFLEEVKEKEAFKNYRYVIDSLTREEMIRELRETNSHMAYWNLLTPMDLFVDIDDRFVLRQRQVDLAEGKQLSMMELVQEIVGSEQPDILVFSSKFVKNHAQVKKFELFLKAFQEKGVRKGLLVTKEPVTIGDRSVEVVTYDTLYTGSNQPHDRYFAFRSNGIWRRYKMSAELDQCRYDRVQVADIHTQGTWNDISFIEILPEVFPMKLNEKISMVEEVHYL